MANRVIRAVCECCGITDIHVKIEGNTQVREHVLKAFILGLLNQKTYQEMADEKQLHVVEFTPGTDYFPRIVASPSNGIVRTRKDIKDDELMDFNLYVYDGKVRMPEVNKPPHYTKDPQYILFIRQWHMMRSRQNVRVGLRAKYGSLDSFLTIREKEERAAKKKQIDAGKIESNNPIEGQADAQ